MSRSYSSAKHGRTTRSIVQCHLAYWQQVPSLPGQLALFCRCTLLPPWFSFCNVWPSAANHQPLPQLSTFGTRMSNFFRSPGDGTRLKLLHVAVVRDEFHSPDGAVFRCCSCASRRTTATTRFTTSVIASAWHRWCTDSYTCVACLKSCPRRTSSY